MGYRVPQGADVVVHAAREVVHDLHDSKTLIKLDKSNAFNSLHRNKMLDPSARPFPTVSLGCGLLLYPLNAFFGDKAGEDGFQQGVLPGSQLSGWPG